MVNKENIRHIFYMGAAKKKARKTRSEEDRLDVLSSYG